MINLKSFGNPSPHHTTGRKNFNSGYKLSNIGSLAKRLILIIFEQHYKSLSSDLKGSLPTIILFEHSAWHGTLPELLHSTAKCSILCNNRPICFFMLTSNTHSLLNRQSGHIRLTENDTIIAKIKTWIYRETIIYQVEITWTIQLVYKSLFFRNCHWVHIILPFIEWMETFD